MEKSNRIERSEVWEQIHNLVKQIPRNDCEGDAPDAPSVTTSIEELFLKLLPIQNVSFSLRDKFAMEAMNGELSAQNFETGEHWANEVDLAERAYLVADAMMKVRSNES